MTICSPVREVRALVRCGTHGSLSLLHIEGRYQREKYETKQGKKRTRETKGFNRYLLVLVLLLV